MLNELICYNSNKRDMHNYTTTLQTFKDWPLSLPITEEQMVQCFSCLPQLSAFEKNDDSCIEQVRYCKNQCPYHTLTVGEKLNHVYKIHKRG